MKIVASGILSAATAGTARACLTFPTITRLSSGELLATGRAGKNKDCDRELIELYRSNDNGINWGEPVSPFNNVIVNDRYGTLKLCYLTEISPGHLLAAAMWVDRATHPGKPLFNAKTEGCLPMAILLADSVDFGRHWSDWRKVEMPGVSGPPSLTNPILKLADGRLAMSIETNKDYGDGGDPRDIWRDAFFQVRSRSLVPFSCSSSVHSLLAPFFKLCASRQVGGNSSSPLSHNVDLTARMLDTVRSPTPQSSGTSLRESFGCSTVNFHAQSALSLYDI